MPAAQEILHLRLGRSPHRIDRHVGARMRERRIMLGLTQQQMAELIGVTYQQAHKYEKGTNRVAAGRLLPIAEALGVDVGYFFDDIDSDLSFAPTPPQPMLLELVRNLIRMPSRKHQEVICSLARTLADPELMPDDDTEKRLARSAVREPSRRSAR
jgi:transcriptional regulator with XRE-family HTH domain